MSRQEEVIRLANLKGYFVNEEGIVFNSKHEHIKLSASKTKYLSFNIRTTKKCPTRCYVHRLQAFQKYKEKIFEEGVVVRHLDNNSLNNRSDNLEIGTQKDNALDIPKEKRIINASHPKHNHENIIKDYLSGSTYKDIMAKYNISSKGTVSFIIKKSIKAL